MSDKQLDIRRLPIFFTFWMGVAFFGLVAEAVVAQNASSVKEPIKNQDKSFEGVIIDSIEITNQDVFDTSNPRYNRFPYRQVNKLHIQTKPFIINAEVLLKVGKPFSWEMAKETERNIRARLFVYAAEIRPERLPDGRLLVRVETIDQWSIAGGVSLRKEADALEYDLTYQDRNLLGLNHRLGLQHTHPANKESYGTLSYSMARIGTIPLSFDFSGTTNTESRGGAIGLSRPYYDRLQKFSYSLNGDQRKGTTTIRDDTKEVAEATFKASSASAGMFYRAGTLRDKVTLGLFYNYQFNRIRDTAIFAETSQQLETAQNGLPIDTNFHEIGFGGEFRRLDYLQLTRIDRYSVVEDFTVGPKLLFIFAKPFTGEQADEHRYEVGAGYTGFHRHTLFFIQYRRGFSLNSATVLKRTSGLSLKLYNTRLSWMTAAFNSLLNTSEVHSGVNTLVLGGFSGLRGYPQYFKTGNRTALISTELRFFSGLDIFSIAIGSAIFADVGSSWKDGDDWEGQPTYGSFGAGLRFNADRVSGGATFRIDVVYSELYGAKISVGLGQNISAKSGEIGLTNH